MKRAINADTQQIVFSEKYFDDLAKNLHEHEKTIWKIRLVNVAFQIILFIQIFSTPPTLSIIGITVNAAGPLREGLLLIISMMQIVTTILSRDIDDQGDILKISMEKRVPKELWVFAQRRYSKLLGTFPDLLAPEKRWIFATTSLNMLRWLAGSVGVVYVSGLILLSLFMQGAIVYNVATHPALPWHWTAIVIGFYGVGVLFCFLSEIISKIPLPYRDYSLLMKLAELQEKNPAAHARRIAQIARVLRK
jgi:hypothetical protein